MAKGKRRQEEQAKKIRKRGAAYRQGGGESRYAKKHRGGGNTGPHGMWMRVGDHGQVVPEEQNETDG